jgi:hypothetical protein
MSRKALHGRRPPCPRQAQPVPSLFCTLPQNQFDQAGARLFTNTSGHSGTDRTALGTNRQCRRLMDEICQRVARYSEYCSRRAAVPTAFSKSQLAAVWGRPGTGTNKKILCRTYRACRADQSRLAETLLDFFSCRSMRCTDGSW